MGFTGFGFRGSKEISLVNSRARAVRPTTTVFPGRLRGALGFRV